MEYVIKTSALSKRYRNFQALDQLSMHVPKGAIYGLVGKNGAGKTTLIRVICGLQKPTSGTYKLYGIQNTDKKILNARRKIGAVVEVPSIYLDMTAEENLKEQYRIIGIPSYDGIPKLLKLVGLDNTKRKKAKHFSMGMRQRLGIAVALSGSPDLLVLDEPVNGLDPQGIIEMRELILKLNQEQQITVIISSHILDELAKLATHYGFINKGSMLKEITAKELIASFQKCLQLHVSDTRLLSPVLDEMGLSYEVLSQTKLNIYSEIPISKLVIQLANAGCDILSLNEQNETLESYYMNLGGVTYE